MPAAAAPASEPTPQPAAPKRRQSRHGRRPVAYDLDAIRKATRWNAPDSEVAAALDLSIDQWRYLKKRKKDVAEAAEMGAIEGRRLLRDAVWRKAIQDRHWAALEFLAVRELGMTEPQGDPGVSFVVEVPTVTPDPDAWAAQHAPPVAPKKRGED